MRLTFVQLHSFASDWRRYKLTDNDLQALEEQIMERPADGVVMSGTGGVRKIRFAPPSWNAGKSGATRVCYLLIVEIKQCFLLNIFKKNEQPNLDANGKAAARKLVAIIKQNVKAS